MKQSAYFGRVIGLVAEHVITTLDYEFLGVLVTDVRSGADVLCILRRLISDRPGAEFSVINVQKEPFPNEQCMAHFRLHSSEFYLQRSPTQARRLLKLPEPMVETRRGRGVRGELASSEARRQA